MSQSEKPKNLHERLMSPVDVSSLATFRVLYGWLMAVHVFVYNSPQVIQQRYVQPDFFFSFPLFHVLQLKPLSDSGMYLCYLVMGLAALFILVGLFYRIAIVMFVIPFGYMFLLEKTYSPNPLYLYLLMGILLMFMSAHRWASFDSVRLKNTTQCVPFWNIFILRAQVLIAFFYSGLGKLTHQDWLQGAQMRIWLGTLKDQPFIGSFITQDWVALAFSYGAIMLELSVGLLLLNKRLRWLGFGLILFFNLWNKFMLGLQIVPWFMIITLVLFLDPDEPRRIYHSVRSYLKLPRSVHPSIEGSVKSRQAGFVVPLLSVYLIVQLVVPLRHWFYPCDVNWTHVAQQFSWHFMNNNIKSEVKIYYSTPEDVSFSPGGITAYQTFYMGPHPDMILQYAHYLRDELKKAGVKNPKVAIDSQVALNGRGYFPLIDSSVDLANEEFSLLSCPAWVLPHPDKQ